MDPGTCFLSTHLDGWDQGRAAGIIIGAYKLDSAVWGNHIYTIAWTPLTIEMMQVVWEDTKETE